MKLTEKQVLAEYGRFAPEAVQRPPLKRKYLTFFPAKFGGQKRKAGNSGGVGKAQRSRARSTLGPGASKR